MDTRILNMVLLPFRQSNYYVPSDEDVANGVIDPTTYRPGISNVATLPQSASEAPPIDDQGQGVGIVPPASVAAPADATQVVSTPKTPMEHEGFKQTMNKMINDPDTYANVTLPIMGILESILTQGKSPGTVSLGLQQQARQDIANKPKLEEEAAQIAENKDIRKANTMKRAKLAEFQGKVQGLDINSPEYLKLYSQYFPEDVKTQLELRNYETPAQKEAKELDKYKKEAEITGNTAENKFKMKKMELDQELQLKRETLNQAKQEKMVPDVEIASMAQDYVAGKMDPVYMQHQIGGFKDPSAKARLESAIKQLDPNFNFATDSADFKRLNSNQVSQQLRAIETFVPNVERLQSAIGQTKEVKNKWLNEQIRNLGVQFGDKTATDINSLVGILDNELGASTTGSISASDYRLQHAHNSLNAGAPKEAAISALDLLRDLELNRHANVAMQGGKYGKDYFLRTWGQDAGETIWNAVIEEKKQSASRFGRSNKDIGMVQPGTKKTYSPEIITRANQAINDPQATPQEKAAAQKIISGL